MMGMHGMAYEANMAAIDDADLVIGVGNRMDDRVDRAVSTTSTTNAKLESHVDIDPARNRQEPAARRCPILGDVKDVLGQLNLRDVDAAALAPRLDQRMDR